MKRVFLTICIWLQFSAVSAATVFFDNDIAGFELSSSTSLTDFDTFLGLASITDPVFEQVVDGNVYSNTGNDYGVRICGISVCRGSSALIYAAGKGGSLRIDLADDVRAVGGIFGDMDGPAGTGLLSIFDNDNNLLDSQKIEHANMRASRDSFYGWISKDATIGALEFMILGDGDASMWAALDDLRFGSLALRDDILAAGSDAFVSNGVSAVPLPAAFWLFLSAMSGLLGLKRLRRA